MLDTGVFFSFLLSMTLQKNKPFFFFCEFTAPPSEEKTHDLRRQLARCPLTLFIPGISFPVRQGPSVPRCVVKGSRLSFCVRVLFGSLG